MCHQLKLFDMRIIPILFCLILGIQSHAQDVSVNAFEYEVPKWKASSSEWIITKVTILQQGMETYEFLDDPFDKSFVPQSRYRYVMTNPYGGFYFDAADSSSVWVRMLSPTDTIRAAFTFSPDPWTLLPDTATIDGFFCRSAERYIPFHQKTVKAWYTEDLGIRAMPKEYLGLPGVLVQSNAHGIVRLKTVRLNEAIEPDLKPAFGKLVTLKRLQAAKSEAQKLLDIMPLKADE